MILATASPEGAAAESILRLSGPGSWEAVASRFAPRDARAREEMPYPGRRPAVLDGYLRIWDTALPAPCLLYFWPRGRGFTAQEAVELHLPGSPPLVQALTAALLETGRVRLAGPGEFTLRAFLAGRIDLVQAEAVLGVIDADGRRSLETALGQLAGGVGLPLRRVHESLLEMLAHLEAGIDFAEEGIAFVDPSELRACFETAERVLESAADRIGIRNARGREPVVVLVGAPNAGKSSLYNRMVARRFDAPDGAIVSPTPGTTRDYLESTLELDGLRVRLIDTAGLDEEAQPEPVRPEPDRIAQSLTRAVLEQADLRLLCIEASRAEYEPWENDLLKRFTGATLLIRTKADIPVATVLPLSPVRGEQIVPVGECVTSSRTGRGIDRLLLRIREELTGHDRVAEVVPATARRCGHALSDAVESLRGCLALLAVEGGMDESLLAAELRTVLDRLGDMLGMVYTEDILERIFSRFCIGK